MTKLAFVECSLKNRHISQLGGDVLELGGAKCKNTWLVCGIGCSCKIGVWVSGVHLLNRVVVK